MNSVKFLLISVDELWLKGKNRGDYVKVLIKHIKHKLKALQFTSVSIENSQQRFIIKSEREFTSKDINELANIPGIYSIVPAYKFKRDLEIVAKFICSFCQTLWKGQDSLSFKVFTNRIDKRFSQTSVEVSRNMGATILKFFNDIKSLKVKMKKPEYTINLKIMNNAIFVSFNEIKAVGGFPVHSNGRIVSLISGGFDSPVASYLMNQRGCYNTYVFFYSYPFVGEEVKDKIIKIVSKLAKYQRATNLYIIPFGKIQKKISKLCKPSYRTMFFRKYMFETASIIADLVHSDALVSGDSLGQVSSQTISNLITMDKFINKSIFRPLIGMSKRDIISISSKINIHDISIIPHDDACSLFAPKKPIITSKLEYWEQFMSENQFDEDISLSIKNAEIIKFDILGNVE